MAKEETWEEIDDETAAVVLRSLNPFVNTLRNTGETHKGVVAEVSIYGQTVTKVRLQYEHSVRKKEMRDMIDG